MFTTTNTTNYAPTSFDIAPASISTFEFDNYSDCLEHQNRVEQYADAYTAIAELESNLAADLVTAMKLRHTANDYRVGDIITERMSGIICQIITVCDNQFYCAIIDNLGNTLLAHTHHIYLSKPDIA
jgi:hypothetical protein